MSGVFTLKKTLRCNLLKPKSKTLSFMLFCTKSLFTEQSESDNELSHPSSSKQRRNADRPLENGLDNGIYMAILVGQVGQIPIQKKIEEWSDGYFAFTWYWGIPNNRRPLDNEEPRDYANRSAVQWHRVSVYPERLGELAMKIFFQGNFQTPLLNPNALLTTTSRAGLF
ncbi:Hypothetical predicted protein [Olea europaea subsp. europaea]|uniref:Uncharacterized protein n=1 Tax=Olea europaea subsp. europaea TaxID=158383 RepID=A0A8S0UZ70_OLEEU|nr:Hypothetical predicted protein [Olea europaea subsp. europaea]